VYQVVATGGSADTGAFLDSFRIIQP
jgi:hypothetical protein